MRVYFFVWIELIYDVIRRGEGEGGAPIKAEPISAAGEGAEGIMDGVTLLYGDIIIIFQALCVGCVETRPRLGFDSLSQPLYPFYLI